MALTGSLNVTISLSFICSIFTSSLGPLDLILASAFAGNLSTSIFMLVACNLSLNRLLFGPTINELFSVSIFNTYSGSL